MWRKLYLVHDFACTFLYSHFIPTFQQQPPVLVSVDPLLRFFYNLLHDCYTNFLIRWTSWPCIHSFRLESEHSKQRAIWLNCRSAAPRSEWLPKYRCPTKLIMPNWMCFCMSHTKPFMCHRLHRLIGEKQEQLFIVQWSHRDWCRGFGWNLQSNWCEKEKVSQQLRDVKNVQRVQMCVKPKINKSQKGRTNENKTDTSGQGG